MCQEWRNSLRNANINYRNGWFFVTCQVAHNKSIFGAIVGERCELNPFGRRVEECWRELPKKYPELELDDFVLMPNHFHAIVRIRFRPTNKEQHLGFLMGRFKGGTGYIYGKLRRAGEVEDIGAHLWQFDYWDKIVTGAEQLAAIRQQGIPPESDLPPALLAACRAGRALLLSPQPSGSRLNKKVATWCNEYVLRHADEIWAGDISPNGMLSSMLKALRRDAPSRGGSSQ